MILPLIKTKNLFGVHGMQNPNYVCSSLGLRAQAAGITHMMLYSMPTGLVKLFARD
jgi:hypothetical protein